MRKEPICKYFARVVVGFAMCSFPVAPGAGAAVNLGSSSWVWQNPLPQGNNLLATTCSLAGDSLNCMAVGDLGTIMFGTATGGSALSWTGQISNVTQTLRAVACTPGNPNNCFAVGDGGIILATTNQGVTWTSRSSGVSVGLTGISCRTTVNCFAIGGGWILGTDDGGATWFGQPHPGGSEPIAVSCPDANTCYAAANNSGGSPVILKTTNGGATWPATSIPGGSTLTAISCGSTVRCVAVDLNGNTYSTTDGTFWRPGVPVVNTVARPNLYGVSCWDAEDCVAVGAARASGNNLFWTNNTGITWNGETSGAGPAILSAVSCSASFCVAAGQLGELVTNYPASSAYTDIRSTVTNKRLTRVSCAETSDCWAVGDGGIFATRNGGTTWVNQYSASGVFGINCPSATTCFAVGGNLIPGTTDGGNTWDSLPLGTNAILNAISCPSTTVCFAGGTSIVATTDGGKTWIPQVISGGFPVSSGSPARAPTPASRSALKARSSQPSMGGRGPRRFH
jgi:Photosynthesis system II assembly factor YCF48